MKKDKKKREKILDLIGGGCGAFLVLLLLINIGTGIVAQAASANAQTLTASAPGKVGDVTVQVKADEKKIYEIEMSNDLVDCAVINGDNKRDDLVSFSIKDCEYIGPVTSDRYESDKADSHYVVKMTDFKNFDIEDTYWYFLVVQEGAKIMVVFHYKDEMYQVFRRYNPRNTIPMNKLPKPAAKKEGDEGDE